MPDYHRNRNRSNFQTGFVIEYAKEGVVCISVLFIVLAVAAAMDLLFDKIYNEWILISVAAGLSYAAWQRGGYGILSAVIAMAVPVMLLYPLFRIGALGAGDVKLLAAAGCFLTVRETVICLGISLFLGAVLSLLKMLAERNFIQRMKYLLSYIFDVWKSREWKFYREDAADRKKRREGKIHFSLPVLLGVVIYKGGFY